MAALTGNKTFDGDVLICLANSDDEADIEDVKTEERDKSPPVTKEVILILDCDDNDQNEWKVLDTTDDCPIVIEDDTLPVTTEPLKLSSNQSICLDDTDSIEVDREEQRPQITGVETITVNNQDFKTNEHKMIRRKPARKGHFVPNIRKAPARLVNVHPPLITISTDNIPPVDLQLELRNTSTPIPSRNTCTPTPTVNAPEPAANRLWYPQNGLPSTSIQPSARSSISLDLGTDVTTNKENNIAITNHSEMPETPCSSVANKPSLLNASHKRPLLRRPVFKPNMRRPLFRPVPRKRFFDARLQVVILAGDFVKRQEAHEIRQRIVQRLSGWMEGPRFNDSAMRYERWLQISCADMDSADWLLRQDLGYLNGRPISIMRLKDAPYRPVASLYFKKTQHHVNRVMELIRMQNFHTGLRVDRWQLTCFKKVNMGLQIIINICIEDIPVLAKLDFCIYFELHLIPLRLWNRDRPWGRAPFLGRPF